MTYSRKGFWITMGLFWAVTACAIAAVLLLHPAPPVRFLIALALMLVAFPLAMRAVFFQDEIQRQTRMTNWYFGSQIGLIVAGIVMVLCVWSLPASLQPFMDEIFASHSHDPDKYLAVGFMVPVIGQVLGTYLMRGVAALRSRT